MNCHFPTQYYIRNYLQTWTKFISASEIMCWNEWCTIWIFIV